MKKSVPSKKPWVVALCVHSLMLVSIGIAAYMGVLPVIEEFHPDYDLVGHFLLIGVLGGLFDGALTFRPLLKDRFAFLRLGPIIIIAASALEETLQRFSPYRSSSYDDFVADVVGILVFSWLAARIESWRRKRSARVAIVESEGVQRS